MKDAKTLLKKMTELYPPNEGQRHNLTLYNNGLQLTLMVGEDYQSIILPEQSLKKSPNFLIDEINELLLQKRAHVKAND